MSREPIHPVTLHFRDAELERRYRAAEDGKTLRAMRLATLIGASLVMGAMTLLHLFVPVEMLGTEHALGAGAAMALVVLLGTASTYTPPFLRYPQAGSAVMSVAFAYGLVAMLPLAPPEFAAHRGFLFLVLHLFTIYGLLRLRVLPAALAGTGAVVLYLGLLKRAGVVDDLDLARHFFWLSMNNVWGILICHQLDLSNRRQFIAREDVERERSRAEALLLNILPAAIAARLKDEQQPIAEHSDEVTVLFADLVGFTPLSAGKKPAELVSLLDRIFTEFDVLAKEHGLEKIKTIGDAYMAVAGLPEARPDHAVRAARMAAAMVGAVRAAAVATGEPLQLRVGLHTGPVVAGVIGRTKFSYDLWGDTVNTASRMESLGLPDSIHCTPATARRLEGAFDVRSRGVIEVKGKGRMETFLVAPTL